MVMGAQAQAGFPRGAWTAYTPTITAGSGTFTSVAGAGRYKTVGKTVFFSAVITITTNGTAATYIILPLPAGMTFASTGVLLVGRNTATGKFCIGGYLSGTSFYVFGYDGVYSGANGDVINLNATFEVA